MDLISLRSKYPECKTFKFGDSEELCNRLLALVRIGKKKATCGSLSVYEIENISLPQQGEIYVVLDWDNSPAVIIQILEVTIKQFNEVDESFALAEGENDTLSGWQSDHEDFFRRNGGFHPQMKLVCERFEVLELLT